MTPSRCLPARFAALLVVIATAAIGLPGAALAQAPGAPQLSATSFAAAPDYFSEVLADPVDYNNVDDQLFIPSAHQNTTPRMADGLLSWTKTHTMDIAWVFAGYGPSAFATGREGLAHPVDASRYTHASLRMYSPDRTVANLLWDRCGPDAGRCLGQTAGFFVEPGWHTYEIPLAGNPGWEGQVVEVRVSVAGDGSPRDMALDWVRLYRPTGAIGVSGAGTALYWDGDADIANNTPENPNWGLLATGAGALTAQFPADAYPAGTYRFYTDLDPTSSTRLDIGTPLPAFVDPDVTGGDDYATVATGNPWDFSAPDDVTRLENVGRVDWVNGRLEATNGGAQPGDNFMDLRLGGPIDARRYHRLTVRTALAGGFDLSFDAGGGAHGRMLWRTTDQPAAHYLWNSKEIVIYPNHDTYTVELATDPAANVHDDTEAAKPGWGGLVDRFRYDPNEDIGPRQWWVDEIKLAADDETLDEAFDIRWRDQSTTDRDGTTVSLYYDTDDQGFDGTLIAADIEQVENENTYRWDTRDVPNGRYHLYAVARRGGAETRRYATGPLVVSDRSSGRPLPPLAATPSPTPTATPTPRPSEPEGIADAQETLDGDPATTERVAGTSPAAVAAHLAVARFASAGADAGDPRQQARHAVLSRDDAFPDSLAGAPLAADGPLLFTPSDRLSSDTADQLSRVLGGGGTVYLLGGEAALSRAVADDLAGRGYDVRRLAGPSRVETSMAVADEVRRLYPSGNEVVVARAYGTEANPTSGWADSVTGGGYAAHAGVPVVVTPTEGVHDRLGPWLERVAPKRTVLLGGTSALSVEVERAVPRPLRVAGAERGATAVAISEQLWGDRAAQGRSYVVLNGYRDDGWSHGLAAAGLAADHDAPLLVVGDDVPESVGAYLGHCGDANTDVILVGGDGVVGAGIAGLLDTLDGGAC